MSIFINLMIIPQRIPPDKWEKVYEESLLLVRAYDFMDQIPARRNGLDFCYGGKSQEREQLPEGYPGWRSVGDMRTGNNTEEYALYRDIRAYESGGKEEDKGEDILLSVLERLDVSGRRKTCMNIWGGRTQGEDSHIYLLAIACLFASRFPEAVMVTGSISAGQCQRAVRWANGYLSRPISEPVTCQMRKLLDRLKKSSLSCNQLLNAFFRLTIGARNGKMGDFLEKEFTEEEIASYYKERLSEYDVRQRGFVSIIREYLEMGFPFERLCRLAVSDADGPKALPEEFLTHILESGLYKEEKNTNDITRMAREQADCEKVDSEREEIAKILGKLCGAENRSVNAFYPLEKIKQDCEKAFGSRCDVDAVIEGFFIKEKANKGRASLQELLSDLAERLFGCDTGKAGGKSGKEPRYDVCSYRELTGFVPGCSVKPELEADLIKNFKALHQYAEAEFEKFRILDRKERENYFITHNRHVLLRKNIWDRIFERVMEDEYIIRIYSLFGVNTAKEDGYLFCGNLFASPDALDYYWEATSDKADKD